MKRKLLLGGMIVVISGCATQSTSNLQRRELFSEYITAQKLEALPHIQAFKFRGWRSLDNEHLIINASSQKPYLITLRGPCQELKFAHGIGINHSSSSLLYSGTDSISVPSFPEQKCYIKSIYALSDAQADEVVKLAKPSDA